MPDAKLFLLACPEDGCPGEIELTKEQYENFMVTADRKSIMYIGKNPEKEGAVCLRCDTEFARKTKFRPLGNSLEVALFLDANPAARVVVCTVDGKVVIEADRIDGDVIVGDSNDLGPSEGKPRTIVGNNNVA